MACDPNPVFCSIRRLKTKRQQAIAEREQALLVLAETILEEHGASHLNMDKLVAASDYSKGTVYNHFSSKEDLFCALCVKYLRLLLDRLAKIDPFQGNTREKVLACHYAYRLHMLMHPTLFMIAMMSQSPAIREKSSPKRLDEHRELDRKVTLLIDQLHQDAVKRGDLRVSIGVSVNNLVFASWAMSFGTNSLLAVATNLETIQRLEMDNTLLVNTSLLMDGMGWVPLSTEFDYQQTWVRIGREIFADELKQLPRANSSLPANVKSKHRDSESNAVDTD